MKAKFDTANRLITILCMAVLLGYQPPAAAAGDEIKRLVVFGDGYSDTGNAFNDSVSEDGAGVPPAPAYFDGRASNGPVWVEHLAEGLGAARPEPMMTGGTNYAWLGAGAAPEGSAPGVPDIGSQVGVYLFSGNLPSDKELYIIQAGISDFVNAGDAVFAVPDPSDLVQNLVASINAIADAAQDGTRLRLLVANLPPMGQTAHARWLGEYANPEVPAIFDRLSARVNKLLSAELWRIAKSRNIDIIELDVYGLSQEIAADPAAFGFTNTTEPARLSPDPDGPPPGVGDADAGVAVYPDDHVYYDDIYPTQNWHRILAERALDRLLEVTP